MSITGIDRITYGVEDLQVGKRFFTDWGLHCEEEQTDRIVFTALNNAQIILRRSDDPALPPAMESGPTLREVIWGVESDAAGRRLADRIAARTDIKTGADGVLRCTDPNGLCLGFRTSRTRLPDVKGAAANVFGNIKRIDEPAPVYRQAAPLSIGHIVVFTDQLETLARFYRDTLGFIVSDSYPGRGIFLRCRAEGGHHNLFLLQLPNGKAGLNHVAFVVRDIHEVFGGGLNMSRCGWETEIGPGRHPISSAYFWYIKSPCGGSVEYYADEDYLTAAWQPREFEPAAENFAEWAISHGIDGATRRQKIISG